MAGCQAEDGPPAGGRRYDRLRVLLLDSRLRLAFVASMPTNHTTQPHVSRRSVLSGRLLELALDAYDVAGLLCAEEMDGPEAEIYVGSPVHLFQRVLDELYWQIRRCYLPPHERDWQLELSRTIASNIPRDRRAKCLRARERLPSALPEYASAEEGQR